MKNVILFMLLTMMSSALFAGDGTPYKGQREYKRQCEQCHGAMLDLKERHSKGKWENWFANNGKKLADAHNATEAKDYFSSQKFQKRSKHIYAKIKVVRRATPEEIEQSRMFDEQVI